METQTRKNPDVSLHQRILSDVEGRILSGEWPPGHRIPFEHELTALYGCSRMTVNKALTDLAKRGFIERRRKAGTYVSHPHMQAAVLEIQDLRREVQSLGLAYSYAVDSRRKRRTTPADRKRLNLTATTLLAVACRHFADNRPFCLEDRLINLAAVPEAANEDFASLSPGSWLLGKVPWSAAEHRIRAVTADDETAKALMIEKGAACLVVERRTWSGDMHITHVRLTYPGDQHELVAQFAPS